MGAETARVPRSCEVCERLDLAFSHYLKSLEGALATRAEAEQRFVSLGGFCARHVELYAAVANPRHVREALAPLLRDVASHLRRDAQLASGSTEATPTLRTAAACPICMLQMGIEGEEISRLNAWSLGRTEIPAAEIPRFCLPHLQTLSGRLDSHALRSALYASQSKMLERWAALILGETATPAFGLNMQEEGSLGPRVIAYLAGDHGISF